MLKRNPYRFLIPTLLIAAIHVLMGYFIERENSSGLLFSFGLLFLLTSFNLKEASLKSIFVQGIIFRSTLLFAIPWLSQDFYRFIWDGLMLHNDLNPYAYSPNEIYTMSSLFDPQLKEELFKKMGSLSAQHFSNYPPLNQIGFWISTLGFQNSILLTVISMRLLIIMADIGLFFILKDLLPKIGLSGKRVGWYFLNPLVIVELTGNLHWEGVMLFFFSLGIAYYLRQKLFQASLFFAFSVAIKLIPLLVFPLFLRFQSTRKSIFMGLYGLGCLSLIFIPFFINIGLNNYLTTLQLWFKNFEFNGSIYYLIRWIGYQIKGYNIIRQLGDVMPWIIILLVFFFSFWKRKKSSIQLFTAMLILLSCYYLLASIVHPWYITNLVFLSMFTRYRFPLIWSALIPLSYLTYAHPMFEENFYAIGLEYGLVFSTLIYEVYKKRPLFQHF